MGTSTTTTIDAAAPVITLINVFTVAPERAGDLLALLTEATEKVMQHLDGFVSANLHIALDGRHVANYAQWRSVADFEAMLTDPVAGEHMAAAAALAEYAPALYRVASVHAAAGDDL
jgi:quinol monooxygenase YgiN